MDGDENNQENTCLCCRPLMPETPYFKKMKPIQNRSRRNLSDLSLQQHIINNDVRTYNSLLIIDI